MEVVGSDDDSLDASCSTRNARPGGAASPSATNSDFEVVDVEIVDLAHGSDAEPGAVSKNLKRDRDLGGDRDKSASPSTSSRSVRLKQDEGLAGRVTRTSRGQLLADRDERKIAIAASSDSDEQRSNSHLSAGDSGRRGNVVCTPPTPDRTVMDLVDDTKVVTGTGVALHAPTESESNATAANTAAAIETVLEGLTGEDGAASSAGDDEDEHLNIPESMLAMPLLRHQKRAVVWMRKREQLGSSPRGGLLADDQGLGKTFSAIALIAANPPPPRWRARGDAGVPKKPGGGTLVVCPTSVLRQWQRELESKLTAAANLRVLVHHGVGRTKLPSDLAEYDVVLTTFAVVGLEVSLGGVGVVGGEKDEAVAPAERFGSPIVGGSNPTPPDPGGAIGGVEWFRVVLDEAQSVKNARSQVAAAVSAVEAKCRWCLSGTPLQNNVDDLFSYFRFLRYDPYDNASAFRTLIKEPIRLDPVVGFRRLQHVLRAVMLRRTKQSKINGAPIVRLPPRTVVHSRRVFLPDEQTAYAKLQAEYRAKMNEFALAGTVSSNYVNLLHMLLRLRQACNHPSLVGGVRPMLTVAPVASSVELMDLTGGTDGSVDLTTGKQTAALVSPVAAKVSVSAIASARRLPSALRGMMRAAAEHGKCVCSICGDSPSDTVVASCCARTFCGDCVSPRVDAATVVPETKGTLGKKTKQKQKQNKTGQHQNPVTMVTTVSLTEPSDGFACPSCGVTLTRVLLHAATALVAADAPRQTGANGSPTQDAPAKRGGKATGLPSGPTMEALMAGTKVRGIMDYLISLRDKHRLVVHAAKQKANSRAGKAAQASRVVPPGGAISAAAVAKGTQLRRGIRSSDAALAAALPPLAPVLVPGRGVSLSLTTNGSVRSPDGSGKSQSNAIPAPEKAIVFSQWTAMLDLLEPCLRNAGIHFRRLDGTMSLSARERALIEFETKNDVTVILMSLKAAGLGVNLTCANHVILSDVWWNPTAEEQAIDRAHRIGQTKEVKVVRFTVRDTVEDRILALQDRKRAMVAAAFGDEADHDGGSSRRAQLTTEDLVFLFGTEKTEKDPGV